MTAKEQLLRVIEDFSEDEAAAVLQLLSQPRDLDSETATRLLDSIPGAWVGAQRGVEDARAGRTTSLADLNAMYQQAPPPHG